MGAAKVAIETTLYCHKRGMMDNGWNEFTVLCGRSTRMLTLLVDDRENQRNEREAVFDSRLRTNYRYVKVPVKITGASR
jgi:hypothetical protein